jgi:GntR family transcriptional regulator, transcriptional repressor for pyruvate dehydrogenase complex
MNMSAPSIRKPAPPGRADRRRAPDRLNDDRELLTLDVIRGLGEPIGSGNLTGIFEDRGVSISPASVGRILNRLERHGYLKKDSNKGRVITAKGQLAMREEMNRRHMDSLRSELDEMLNNQTLRSFQMILETRKVIEAATARLAAEHISAREIAGLENILREREEHLSKSESIAMSDIDFHTLLASASRNDVLALIYRIISHMGQQSELFEYMRKKASGAYLRNHAEIVEALKERDGTRAEQCMLRHIETLIHDVQKYWSEHPGPGPRNPDSPPLEDSFEGNAISQ